MCEEQIFSLSKVTFVFSWKCSGKKHCWNVVIFFWLTIFQKFWLVDISDLRHKCGKKRFREAALFASKAKKPHFLKTNTILFWSELFFLFLACTIKYVYEWKSSFLLFDRFNFTLSSNHFLTSFFFCIWTLIEKKKMHSPTVLSTKIKYIFKTWGFGLSIVVQNLNFPANQKFPF